MAQWALRPGRLGDVGAVLALERETAEAPHWSETDYVAIVSEGDGHDTIRRCLFVIEDRGLLRGFCVGSILLAEQRGEIESVAVAVSARRIGVGRALCGAVVDWCRVLGAGGVQLEVRTGSAGAIALYKELGFVVSGRRSGYYAQPVEDAVLMALSLAAVEAE